ncbi:hypothetical protein GmHk_04G010031 [Glycine max]|nr:hypothetical protein GmHk_04G010031 [Glycine max]
MKVSNVEAAIPLNCTLSNHDPFPNEIRCNRSPADSVNEYVEFLNALNEYLRSPKNNDINRLLQIGKAWGFQDLWIWHAYYGVAGSNNDINMLNQPSVFNYVLQDRTLPMQFTINETLYNMGYYLVDHIYPDWATFLKTIPMSQGEKKKLFTKCQE